MKSAPPVLEEKVFRKLSFFIALLCAVIGGGAWAVAADAPQADKPKAEMSADVKPGDCAGCHKDAKVVPRKHVATTDMVLKDCQGCHGAKEGGPDALPTTVPLGHLHALKGVQCAQCHESGKPAAVSMTKCLTCHTDMKALAQKTANVQPTNPHDSRHYGTEADCNLCHHQHKMSENHCAECHNFKFNVP